MVNMKIIFFAVMLSCGSSAIAQKEVGGELAIGARFGGVSALDIKKYRGNNNAAFEFIAGWNFDNDVDGFTFTGLWEKLAPLTNSRQVNAIIGLGPTMAFGDDFRFGASGILGVDWRFEGLPLNLQFDWSPTWFFVNGNDFSFVNGAVSVRYIINNRNARK